MLYLLTNVNVKKSPPLYGGIHIYIHRRPLWGVGWLPNCYYLLI